VRACVVLFSVAAVLLAAGSDSVALNARPVSHRVLKTAPPAAPSDLCQIVNYDICSGWLAFRGEREGGVWGAVIDPRDCGAACANGGTIRAITFYTFCNASPAEIGGIGISSVDASNCLTASLYDSGPTTVYHCDPLNPWTTITTPPIHVGPGPFAVTLKWGALTDSTGAWFATDSGIANLYCHRGVTGAFPGCAGSTASCSAWTLPVERSFIYVTDVNGDGTLDDVCQLYGAPIPLHEGSVDPYGYLADNLLIEVTMDCESPTAVEAGSWGRVKALFR